MSSGMEAKGSGGSRARRKLLTAEEAELFELAQAAGTGLDPEVFKILLDLLRMNVAPVAIYQVLRAMCAAGQRVSGPEANATEPPRGLFAKKPLRRLEKATRELEKLVYSLFQKWKTDFVSKDFLYEEERAK
ncbi:mitotic-spindle organizing protein 2 isoform X4 [Anolis carolinensis]|uniref:mitotic-spindle organizing protein 2 isoform X4 n=1 Tax=Anolis carolinensis TaxID=28377 RepID=UPI002F2B37E0